MLLERRHHPDRHITDAVIHGCSPAERRARWLRLAVAMSMLASLYLLAGVSSLHGLVKPGADKIIHVLFFMLTGLLLLLSPPTAVPMSHRAWRATVVTGLILAGALDEIHQAFTPGRSADWLDWLADVSGVTLAALLVAARRPRAPRRVAPVADLSRPVSMPGVAEAPAAAVWPPR